MSYAFTLTDTIPAVPKTKKKAKTASRTKRK
jgi:hypothetical protein